MRRSRRNLAYHELVGLEVMVKEHTCEGLKGLSGKVVDETMNTLVIRGADGRLRRVPKEGGVFLFKLDEHHTVEVRGDSIVGRPEDRLKRYGGA